MNLITHRLTLDVLKNGVQKILHGFFAGEVLSRRIAITLTAGSTSVELAQDAVAVMYITKSNGTKSINACSVVGNTVLYDILQTDTDTTGITMMQIKVVSNDKVVYAPIFAIEVQAAIGADTEATTSPTYTALEEALVKAEEAYNARLVSVDIEEDLTFKATYADGTEHTSDAIKNAFAAQSLDYETTIADLEALKTELSTAEKGRATAEAQRVIEHEAVLNAEAARAETEVARAGAEAERVEAEQQRATTFTQMASDVQSALDETTALQKKVEEMAAGGGVDLTGYATEEYVDEAVKNAGTDLTGYATETYVDNAVSGLASTDYVNEAIQNASTGDVDLTGYATEEYVNNAVSGFATTEEVAATFSGYASKEYVNNSVSGLATKEEVTNAVSGLATTEDVTNAVSGLATTEDVTNAVSGLATTEDVTNAVSGLASTEDVSNAVSGLATAESVNNIVNGTTPAGNANAVDGYHIAITGTDPGAGVDVSATYADNTIIFVKETA